MTARLAGFYGAAMGLFGIKGLASMAGIVLLVSGCSSTPESKPEYDQLQLVIYENCLDALIEGRDWERLPDGYNLDVWQNILESCKTYKPRKHG